MYLGSFKDHILFTLGWLYTSNGSQVLTKFDLKHGLMLDQAYTAASKSLAEPGSGMKVAESLKVAAGSYHSLF